MDRRAKRGGVLTEHDDDERAGSENKTESKGQLASKNW
jgi:hypothetical protein